MNVYRLALVASAGAAVGFVAVFVDPPTPSSTTEAAAGSPPRVRIEHQFVRIHNTSQDREPLQATVEEIRVPANPAPESPAVFNGAAKSTPTAARASSPGRSSTGAERSGILPRVGRLLVGDGRHRPEPFPRPGE